MPTDPVSELGSALLIHEKREEALARIAVLEKQIADMTEDRNLWQADHWDTCPCAVRVEALEKALRNIELIAENIPTANATAFAVAIEIADTARAALEGK